VNREQKAFERAFVYFAAHAIFIALLFGLLYGGIQVVRVLLQECR
jgi:hypothetical protein